MPYTIFFSWQADTPTRDGRNLIQRSLERALDRIAADAAIDEPVREGLELDRDTKGVPGSPPIVDTIFRKIDEAALFVPDLTFVGKRLDGRPTPNPNVLIEYGWALKSLGHARIVPVMNTAFGEPTAEAMPFDMRHLRNPICYHVPDTADEETRKKERENLMKQLEGAIRTVLASKEFKASLPSAPAFISAEPKDGPSCFLTPDEPLATFEDAIAQHSYTIKLRRGPHMYLRVMPTSTVGRWNPLELERLATEPHRLLFPMGRPQSADWGRNRYGFVITNGTVSQTGEATRIVQVFQNGEVWSIDALSLFDHDGKRRPLHDFERDFVEALDSYRRFLAEKLNVRPPFRWIVGMAGLEGRQIALPPPPPEKVWFNPVVGRCTVDILSSEGTIGLEDDPAKTLHDFFKDVWAYCGVDRAEVHKG